ncbi:MAG: WYL domain-containing protein [candidate division Zixibacteria bacterium]|nr:WYL domain-containing protein [candidate division Zixibacteria bacterium]
MSELLLNRPLTEVALAYVDVETTGLSPDRGDRVCEIAIIRQEPDGSEHEFVSFVDPEREISAGAFAVNGITPEMLAGAPRFADLIEPISNLLSHAAVVAHNARFDLGFLRSEFARCDHRFPEQPVIDTVSLARRHFQFPSNRLEAVARALGVRNKQEHRALADTRMTQQILRKMLQQVYGDSPVVLNQIVESLGDLPYQPVEDLSELDALSVPPSLVDIIARCGELRIEYVTATGGKSVRRIRARKVVRLGSYMYLVAECLERNAERHFRLDRIVDWTPPESATSRAEADA